MRIASFKFDPENDRLGEGPQSEVFRATDTRLDRTVALKILRPHVEFDAESVQRFEREARHASHLTHPNIATIYEYGKDRGTSYIAMEYLEGRTLDKIIKSRSIGYDEGVRLALQATSALGLVHERGIIHRDLKPANIMVMGDGTVKLLDFGICRSSGESNITQEGMLVGTVLYMSPEQVLGEELDVRTDIFALGSVFYHCFTGELSFPGKSFPEVCMAILEASPRRPSEVRSGFPPALEEFLLKAMSRDPNDRYPHGGAAYGALLAVADSLRLTGGSPRASVHGQILIPPLDLKDPREETRQFAIGLRRDLSSELGRSTELRVSLPNDSQTGGEDNAFVLRGSLEMQGETAVIDYALEQARNNGKPQTKFLWTERIEHSDNDEWGLQAKLVGSLVRSIKKKLPEYTLAPQNDERDSAKALESARRAHSILHRGTSRHLMMSISIFRRALEEDPTCALAHAGLAEALVRKFMVWDGDRTFLQESIESARRALAFDPLSAEAHTSLGYAHFMVGETTDAQREFRLAIQTDKNEWLAHRHLGALLGRLGNYQGASPLLQRAIALQPTHIASYDRLYGVLCRMDRYQEAIEIADRGISAARRHLETQKDDQDARLHLGLLLARMGLSDDAKKVVHTAQRMSPKDAYTCYLIGIVHALLGEVDPALKLLREAQVRGYYLQNELLRNGDLEILRGRPEFQMLIG